MSKESGGTQIAGLAFPLFIALKFAGPCAAWSWWWLLAPFIPILTEIVKWVIR